MLINGNSKGSTVNDYGISRIIPFFHISGVMPDSKHMLNKTASKLIKQSFLITSADKASIPYALLFFKDIIVSTTSCGEIAWFQPSSLKCSSVFSSWSEFAGFTRLLMSYFHLNKTKWRSPDIVSSSILTSMGMTFFSFIAHTNAPCRLPKFSAILRCDTFEFFPASFFLLDTLVKCFLLTLTSTCDKHPEKPHFI